MARHIERIDLANNANPGLFCIANDNMCLASGMKKSEIEVLEEVLKVDVKDIEIADTNLLGIFSAMNSKGIAIPYLTEKGEMKRIEKLGLNIFVCPLKETALGNLILVNDKGCLIGEELEPVKEDLEKCFGVPVEIGTIAGLSIVGSCGSITNSGGIVHVEATDEEIETIEKLFGVEVGVGTVNFGSPYVGAGIVANSNGFITSRMTTGPEVHRIDESLGFI